jgi:hypothetical protein
MVTHTSNPSTWEGEEGGLRVPELVWKKKVWLEFIVIYSFKIK